MVCDKCSEDKSDVMVRGFTVQELQANGFVMKLESGGETTFDPKLCTACCSEMPGRAWMKTGL